MKKTIVVTTMIALLFFTALPGYADVIGTARLSLILGDVVMQTGDTGDEWLAASINLPLMPGDRVWVPENGRAEIQFIGGTYLRADGNTGVDITNLRRDSGEGVIQAAVPQGRIYVNYRGSSRGNAVMQIDTPLVSAMSYGSAKFEVNVYEDGYTEVAVRDGEVHVEGEHGTIRVAEGNMISVGPDHYAELSPLRLRDEWTRWNASRDYALDRSRESSRYLPPALAVYNNDFDEYGRWVHTPDYGYVWTPAVVVSDWAPYRKGRWVWRHGDYVWISYEPWGWVPYHYGRWSFRVGIGWFWVPPAVNAIYWAPGFVAWIHTPAYVSWVPLAPGEVYYGHGYFGPHSVNLTKVNRKTINITNIYINSRVKNAVTVVHHETFLTGKHVKGTKVHANPFVAGLRVSPGRPEIRPVKATSLPLPEKIVPQKSLPSGRVIEKVKATGKRPVAVKRDTSVFRPGKQVSPLPVRKVAKPKPMKEIPVREKAEPQPRKDVTERPVVQPKEDVGGREVPRRDIRPSGQKGISEKPVQPPKVDKGKTPYPGKETGKPPAEKKTIEKPATMPGKGGQSPVQKKGKGSPDLEKENKKLPVLPGQGETAS